MDKIVQALSEQLVEDLEAYGAYMSGILVEGVTLEDVIDLRSIEAELRAALRALIEKRQDVPDSLLQLFHESIAETDRAMANSPLEIVTGGVVWEVQVSEAMRMISEEYQRLGLVSLNDFERLPGIDHEDMEGLETLQEYLAWRQVRMGVGVPVFDSLSPRGAYTLIDRLVRKYADYLLASTYDKDSDGKREIDYELFREMVNGVRLTMLEADGLIAQILSENQISWGALQDSVVRNKDLSLVFGQIDGTHREIYNGLVNLVENKGFEDVFTELIKRFAFQKLRDLYTDWIKALDDAMAIDEYRFALAPRATLPDLPSVPSVSELTEFLNILTTWNRTLNNNYLAFIATLDVSDKLIQDFRSIHYKKLNLGDSNSYPDYGLYGREYRPLREALWFGSVRFERPGGQSVVIDLNRSSLLRLIPFEIAQLLENPGIAAIFSEEDLKSMHSGIDGLFFERVLLEEAVEPESPALTTFGRNIELIQLLIERYDDLIVRDGELDQVALGMMLFGDEESEAWMVQVLSRINSAMKAVDDLNIDLDVGLRYQDYEAVVTIQTDARREISDLVAEYLAELDPEHRVVVEGLFEIAYARLVSYLAPIYSLDDSKRIIVTVDQTQHFLATASFINELFEQLRRVAVLEDRDSTNAYRRQYTRLNGIDEDSMLRLRTDSEVRWQGQIRINQSNAYAENRTLDQEPALHDVAFIILPKLIESFAEEILNTKGEVDLRLFSEKLTEGVYVPVEYPNSISDVVREIVVAHQNQAFEDIAGLDYRIWDERMEAEAILSNMLRTVAELAEPLTRNLDEIELDRLEYRVPRLYDNLLYRYYRDVREIEAFAMRMGDGIELFVPAKEIQSIPRFPYDREHFIGIVESDFEGVGRLSLSFHFTNSGELEDSQLFEATDEDKLVANIVRRFYNDFSPEFAEIRADMFRNGRVSLEVFRRAILGLDALHRELVAEASELTDAFVDRNLPRAQSSDDMTIEMAMQLFDELLDLQAAIVEGLRTRASKHEDHDVIEIEESASEVYRNAVDLVVDYYRSHILVTEIEGKRIRIPYQDIQDEIVNLLTVRFPGESIGAHHIASFYGVSIEDLQAYNRLEAFLGAQIIALPRNSQHVEILSKLSELGFMQLAVEGVQRHSGQVVDLENERVDVEALLDALSDLELAKERAKAVIEELSATAREELNTVSNELTFESFERILGISEALKRGLANRLNGHVSGFPEDVFEELKAIVDQRFLDFKSLRDAAVFDRSMTIHAFDDEELHVNLSEIEAAVVAELNAILAEKQGGQGKSYHDEIDDSALDSLPRFIWWKPDRVDINPEDTLTRLGLHHLIGRLIKRYGITVMENGEFSLEKFLAELRKSNESRIEALVDNLKKNVLEALDAMIPEGDAAIALEEVFEIHELLLRQRRKFSDLVMQQVDEETEYGLGSLVGHKAWRAVTERYEQGLWSRNVIVTVDGTQVELELQWLVNTMDAAYDDGRARILDTYLENGESMFHYLQFAYSLNSLYRSSNPEYDESEEGEGLKRTVDTPRYPFKLGELVTIPGISAYDLIGLDTEQEDFVAMALLDARELVRGSFNLRLLSPGTALQTINEFRSIGGYQGVTFDDFFWIPGWGYSLDSYSNLSQRDIRYRLLVELIEDYADLLIDEEGDFDRDAFEALLDLEVE